MIALEMTLQVATGHKHLLVAGIAGNRRNLLGVVCVKLVLVGNIISGNVCDDAVYHSLVQFKLNCFVFIF